MPAFKKGILSNFFQGLSKTADETVVDTLRDVVDIMQAYPPERPNQKYIRTYTFRDAWNVTQLPDAFEIENFAEQNGIVYAGWVVGNARGNMQADVHAGRWKVFKEVFDKAILNIPYSIRERLTVTFPFVSKDD